MTDPTYNEDIRAYITDRYDALGNASRHTRDLVTAKNHDKFTTDYTTVMRDLIADYLNLHHADDPEFPDLDEWAGENTPQRAYQVSGGDIGDASSTSGFWFTENYTSGVMTSTTILAGNHGDHFTLPPTVTLEHVNGTGADVRCVMGWVTGCSITAEGDDYTSTPTVAISAPDDTNGTQATMAVYRGWVTAATVTAGGTGYVAADTVTIGGSDDNNEGTASASLVVESGVVTGIVIDDGGSGYTNVPSVTINSSTGSGAAATAVTDDSVIAGCYIITAGAGYTTTPTATMSGGGGTGAALDVLFNPGVVGDVYIVSGGTGYDVGVSGYPTLVISATPPAAPASTTAQKADDDYVPDSWTEVQPVANSTDGRYVWRTERTGFSGSWVDWATPTLVAEYSV